MTMGREKRVDKSKERDKGSCVSLYTHTHDTKDPK